MKKTRPIAGQGDFKRYAREKVKQLWDEVVELIFCSLLSSHLMDQIIDWSQGTILHSLFGVLQSYSDLVGLLKIMLTFLFFVLWRFVRYCLSCAIDNWCKLYHEFGFFAPLYPAISSRGRFCGVAICGLVFAVIVYSSRFFPF